MSHLTGNTGPIDYQALQRIRDIVLEHEPLVTHHDLGNRLDPQLELNITVLDELAPATLPDSAATDVRTEADLVEEWHGSDESLTLADDT